VKKVLSLLLVFVFALQFVSCDKNEKMANTITWYAFGDEQPDMERVMEAANAIIEPELGVKLDLKFIPASAYDERMKMMMASGSEFDICFTSNWKNDYVSAARDGGLLDITDLISDDLYSIMDAKYWNDMKLDQKIYAVPNQQVMFQQLAVGIQTELVEKYDFDMESIEHIEDIEPMLEVIKKNEPNLFPYNSRWSHHPWTYDLQLDVSGGNGIRALRESGEIIEGTLPEYDRAVEVMRDWYQKGYIRKDYASSNGDNNITDINQGKYAVIVTTWKPGIEQFDTIKYTYKTISKPYFTGATATALGIGAGSKDPEKALELIHLVNTNKELYNLICYGIEGEHYKFNEDGKLKKIENSGYDPATDWQFGNQFNAYISEGMDESVWEETKRLNDESIVSVLTTFKLNTDPIKSEIAQINSVGAEYADFITVKDYSKYIKERDAALEAAGFDRVFDEINKQLKVHVKANQ